ncbi:hypothetical protein FRX31_025098, partial [Thalictrum thalictroides]
DNIRNLDCNAQSSFDSFEETLHLMYPNETDHIKFPIGKDVFAGEDMEFGYIPKRNILDVCQMKDLDLDILIVYMRFHFVLIVVDLSHLDVYWLDSLHGEPQSELKILVNNVLMAYKMIEGTKIHKPICWQCIKGPRQPNGNLTCGFYAMRFMKDMMEDSEQTVAAKIELLMCPQCMSDIRNFFRYWVPFCKLS